MFVYIIGLLAVAIGATGFMLWPTHLLPLWRMYRADDFTWAESQGITAPRLGIIGAGASGVIGVIAGFYVLFFVSWNPALVLATVAVVAVGPSLGLAVLALRSMSINIRVWFDDGSEFGGCVDSKQPRRNWFDSDPQLFMPVGRGEQIWLHAPADTTTAELADPDNWVDFEAPNFLATAGQNSSLFFARCDTSALRRNSMRRNKASVKADTIKASIIFAFAALFGLLGFLGMTAATPAP